MATPEKTEDQPKTKDEPFGLEDHETPFGGPSAEGGTSQDSFGQSGQNNSPDQTAHNLHGGGVTGE